MRILVPIDGSVYSENSLAFLSARANLMWDSPCIDLLIVFNDFPSNTVHRYGDAAMRRYFEEESERVFSVARKYLTGKKVTVTESYLVGNPADKISEYAESTKPDLIVMGSHGRTALEGLFMGSVTSGVLARTKQPMIVIRSNRVPPVDQLKIGIAVDGSEYGKAAVNYAIKHMGIFGSGAEITLINVAGDYTSTVMPDMAGMALPMLSDPEIRELQEKEYAEAINPLLPLFERSGISVKAVSLIGNPGDEIAHYAKDHQLDLIMMGSHGYGRIKSAIMGSTAMRIAAQGDVPLMLIRD